jgi:ribA/ribD-fused uncharacterized protein
MAHPGFVFFWQSGSPFSQWHPAGFVAKSSVNNDVPAFEFKNAEQFMMAEKALLMEDMDSYQLILKNGNPKYVKAIGRKVRHWDEKRWKAHREGIVYAGNLHKFSQNQHLKKVLLDTEFKELVEAAPNDRIWGIGLRASDPRAKDRSRWHGLNLLGKALMKVRETLSSDVEEETKE